MSILDSVKKTLTKTAKDAAKVSGDLVEQTKLKIKAIDIKDEIDSRYTQIGKLYYGVVENENDDAEKIEKLVGEITELKGALAEIEAEIKISKKVCKCQACDTENDVDDAYCSKCGNKLK